MKNLLLITCCLVLLRLPAQNGTTHPWTVRAAAHTGLVLPEYGFLSSITTDYIRGVEVNVLHQTSGSNYWQQLYRYPAWGVSFFASTMGNSQQLGNQYSLYPYYRLRLAGGNRLQLSYQMGVGLSWATKKFDIESNYLNVAIATHLNIHYHADLLLQARITDRLGAQAGLAFNHISNANLGEPNVGLNFATAYTGFTWNFGQPVAYRRDSIPQLTPETRYAVMVTGGIKRTRTFESFNYPAMAVMFNVSRRSHHKFAWGFGVDFFYDSSVEDQLLRQQREFKSSYAYTTGIHATQEFIYNKFSLLVQEGFYIGLRERLSGYFMYNRAMVRYQCSPHLFVNFSMKSHLYVLDFPELGLGYKWK